MLTRMRVPELMDDPALDPLEHSHARIGLERLNTLGRIDSVLWRSLKELIDQSRLSNLRVLDLATGSGGVPLGLWARARAAVFDLQIAGCDFSDVAVSIAQECARKAGAAIDFFVLDVLNDSLPQDYDVIITSLFTHHLSEDEVVDLMRRMKSAAKRMVVINDLERSHLNLALVWLATRLVTTSPVVRFDGPASVRNAYTAAEFRRMAAQAGLDGAVVRASPPCRMMLVWRK